MKWQALLICASGMRLRLQSVGMHVRSPLSVPVHRIYQKVSKPVFLSSQQGGAHLFEFKPRPKVSCHRRGRGNLQPSPQATSLLAKKHAFFRRVEKKSAPSPGPRLGLQQRRFSGFLELHRFHYVLTWSWCFSRIDVCTLLPGPFFVASTKAQSNSTYA